MGNENATLVDCVKQTVWLWVLPKYSFLLCNNLSTNKNKNPDLSALQRIKWVEKKNLQEN